MSKILQSSLRNKIIGQLSPGDFSALATHLTPVTFTKDETLTRPEARATHCWFPESGIASVVATSPSGLQAEVGLIGCEGMIDVSACLGVATPRMRTFIQLAGIGHRVPLAILTRLIDERPSARKIFLAYVYDFLAQVSHTAFVNANLPVDARLARWLLMYDDRIPGAKLLVTHDFLSLMLGVRRAGVTVALASLKKAGLITLQRGALTVTNRDGLALAAGEGYGWAEWPQSETPPDLPIAM